MTVALEVHPDAQTAARRVAESVAGRVRSAAGPVSLAFSRARPALLDGIVAAALPWERVTVYQVDERVAPRGTPERNLTALLDALPAERVHPMPVDDGDLEEAAARYADALPARLDLVHLGLGADGHTASLVPGDEVLEIRHRRVAVTDEYEGHRRMTLTYPTLEAAREIVWLVTGEDKRAALQRLLVRDLSIPAARIANPNQLVVADAAAAASPSR